MRIEPKRGRILLASVKLIQAPQHHDVAMGEVDELQDPVDHRVAERDQRIQAADRQGGHQGLSEVGHEEEAVEQVASELVSQAA